MENLFGNLTSMQFQQFEQQCKSNSVADQDNDSHILLVAENDTILAKGHAIITQLLSADEPTRAAIRREQLISVHSGGSMLSVGTAMSQIYDRAENGPAVTFP